MIPQHLQASSIVECDISDDEMPPRWRESHAAKKIGRIQTIGQIRRERETTQRATNGRYIEETDDLQDQ